jgi:hypothetical protein
MNNRGNGCALVASSACEPRWTTLTRCSISRCYFSETMCEWAARARRSLKFCEAMPRTREPVRACARLGKNLPWIQVASVCRHLH